MMSGLGERKFWILSTILVIILIIGFVFASGCEDISKLIGGMKPDTQTTPTPETPEKDITQTTQALGTPGSGTGGGAGGSESGCDCDRHAFINQQFDGVEYHLAEQLTTSCFHLVSHSTRVENEPLKPINPQPEEYYFNSLFIDNLGGEFDENGKEIKSRETIELYFNGNPEDLVKTLTSESSLNDLSSHTYRMWKNKDAVINQIKPIDAFLKDYERMPISGQITPSKNEVDPSETIDVIVDSLQDSQGRPPKTFQRILVKAENGKILGGTQAGKYRVFKATDSSIKVQYQAPDSCDKATSDTITIYNSCDIADKTQSLANTTPKTQIGIKTINLKCNPESDGLSEGKPGSARNLEDISDVEFDGDIVVWEDKRNFDDTLDDIYIYNIKNRKETPLITDKNRQWDPSISGNRIVWADSGGSCESKGSCNRWDIFLYDLSTGVKSDLTNSPEFNQQCDIDGNKVVYDCQWGGLCIYDISTNKETLITDDGRAPRISGNHIIFARYTEGTRSDLIIYSISSKKETCVTCGMEAQGRVYRIDGDYVVFSTSTIAEPLYLYNIQLGLKLKLLPATIPPNKKIDTDWADSFDISGNKVVFVARIFCPSDDESCKPNTYGIFVYDIPSLDTFKEAAIAAVLSEKGYTPYRELARSDMYRDQEIGNLGRQILRISGDNLIYNIGGDFHIKEL